MNVHLDKLPCSWWSLLIIVVLTLTVSCNEKWCLFWITWKEILAAEILGVKAETFFNVERAHSIKRIVNSCYFNGTGSMVMSVNSNQFLSCCSTISEFSSVIMKQAIEKGERYLKVDLLVCFIVCFTECLIQKFSHCVIQNCFRKENWGKREFCCMHLKGFVSWSMAEFKLSICGFELWILKCLMWACHTIV